MSPGEDQTHHFAARAGFDDFKNNVGIYQGGRSTSYYEDETGDFKELGTRAQTVAFHILSTVTVNTSGPFLDPRSKSRIGNYPAISKESRLLQILHELAHLVHGADGNPLIVPDYNRADPNDSRLSIANTEQVKKACEKEIEAASKEKW